MTIYGITEPTSEEIRAHRDKVGCGLGESKRILNRDAAQRALYAGAPAHLVLLYMFSKDLI